ncbi:hypothetical protein EJB05_06288, partial [Eragrostis curvula]
MIDTEGLMEKYQNNARFASFSNALFAVRGLHIYSPRCSATKDFFTRKPTPMKVKILQWHAVASWTWDAQDETCGICRMPFDGCCTD